jgi:VanZ family protein
MWLIVILIGYMAGIFLLSSIPDTGDTGHMMAFVPSTIQNILHIPVYGLLALLWILTLRTRGFPENKSVRAAILLSSACGGLMEIYQTWVPGRFPSVMDFFFNVAGILLFVWIYQQFKGSIGNWVQGIGYRG